MRIAGIAVSAGMLTLLIAPTVWSSYSVIRNTESSFPTAGPNAGGNGNIAGFPGFGGSGDGLRVDAARTRGQNVPVTPFDGTNQPNPALISYLKANQGNAKFLVAVPSSSQAAPIVLATNRPVMAMGGFSGNDPILTTNDLQDLISNGTVRFFLINPPRSTQQRTGQLPAQSRGAFPDFGGGNFGGQSALSAWIGGHCSIVPASAWQSSRGGAGVGGSRLYNCAVLNA